MGALYLVALTNLVRDAARRAGLRRHLRRRRDLRRQGDRRQRVGRALLPAAAALHAVRADHASSGSSCSSPATAAGRGCAPRPRARRPAAAPSPPRCGPRPHSSASCAAARPPRRDAARRASCAPRRRGGGRPLARLRMLAADRRGCLAVAALTLLFPSTPTYDPWAWILWGREIVAARPGHRPAARPGSRCRSCSRFRSRCSATTSRRYLVARGSRAPAACSRA